MRCFFAVLHVCCKSCNIPQTCNTAYIPHLYDGLQSLHGKQGKKWSSKKERDDSLNAEVHQLQETLSKQQDYTQTLQTEVAQLSSACMDKSQEIGNQQAAIKQRKDNLTRCDR